jgi:hypothetical protein
LSTIKKVKSQPSSSQRVIDALIDSIAHPRFFGIAPFIFGDATNR